MIIEREPKDCLFRNVGERRFFCRLIANRNDCEPYYNSYPNWCPLLSGEVIVRAIIQKPEEVENGKV